MTIDMTPDETKWTLAAIDAEIDRCNRKRGHIPGLGVPDFSPEAKRVENLAAFRRKLSVAQAQARRAAQ